MSTNGLKAGSNPNGQRWGNGQRFDNPQQGAARITEAARHCFSESGVASTTIDQIAQYAGVSRRTVYRYFDNKEAVVLAVVEEQAEPFFVEMRESLSGFQGDFRQILIHCVMFAIERGPLMEGHQMLLGKANGAATASFYLGSANLRKNLRMLLEESFVQAQTAGNVDSTWQLNDLLNWLGRLIYSFIQHPEPAENIERLVNAFLLPAEIPPQSTHCESTQ